MLTKTSPQHLGICDKLVTKKTKKHATYNNNEWTYYKNQEVEPIQSVQMNIHQSNTYKKRLTVTTISQWLKAGNK